MSCYPDTFTHTVPHFPPPRPPAHRPTGTRGHNTPLLLPSRSTLGNPRSRTLCRVLWNTSITAPPKRLAFYSLASPGLTLTISRKSSSILVASLRDPLNLCGEPSPLPSPGDVVDISSYDYNPETFVLRISGMPAGAHNELEYFIHSCLTLLLYHRFIDLAEYKQIDVGWSSAFILPGRATTPQIGRKPPAVAKVPDCYIGLRDKGESWFPRVVFEVGFSQSYEEVRDDAYQWLVRSDGGIPLVVLIKIEEHPIPAPPPDDDPQSDDSADSDVAIYRRLRAACDVDSLVGPISAFAELYRYGPAGVYLDGDRIVSTPPPSFACSADTSRISSHPRTLFPQPLRAKSC